MDELERLAVTHNTVHALTDFATAHYKALVAGGMTEYTAEYLTQMYYGVLLRNYERSLLAAHDGKAAEQRDAAIARLSELLKKEPS